MIAPTFFAITRILTFSVESFCSISLRTSAVPPTSVLMMTLSSFVSPSLADRLSISSVMRLFFDIACSRAFDSRYMTICFAFAVSVITWKLSPTSGRASRPMTSTAVDGSASRTC